MKWLLFAANTFDAFSTYVLVTRGLATEANPIMAGLLAWSPVAFLSFKIVAVNAGVFVIARRPRALHFISGVYCCLAALHLALWLG